MTNVMDEIEEHVGKEMEAMTPSQIKTLKALLFSGYKGERELVLLELLRTMKEEKITSSSLVESFASTFEEDSATYWRIKPEFFRAVRKELFKKQGYPSGSL
ncbi:MAG: hypothetical protein ACE5HH_00285 [Candidatus Hydrothermarchaeales archaeon]